MAALVLSLSACTTAPTIKFKCPPLSPAPSSVVDGLEVAARKDPSAAAWVIDLDRHYQKCDIINGSH